MILPQPDPFFLFQTAIVMAAVIIAGLVGYAIARRHFRSELDQQERMFGSEIGRLRRQATAATARARTLKHDLERITRRTRRAQN